MKMSTILKFTGLVVIALVSVDVLAANAGMPWEGPLDRIVRSVQGPVAKGIGVVALTGTGLGVAMGLGGDIVQKGAKVGLGLSIAYGAVTWGLPLFGFGNGLVI
ncbi:type IV secretion system protein VirB2 [Rheinheimera pacifica]|uniref:TrbC/VirB2 family protein n=1 Tax=Rheinheimera pacifica TaxID=173990 RepID=UPI00216A22D2|nr:TrbC/VirB2 family protein [Rheinheimera pacifica]MCS4309495.1 type IV secretion system protein VirB2 [Rheinheimera pacifica]